MFATEALKEGFWEQYAGKIVKKEPKDATYCWARLDYDREDGSEQENIIGYVDARDSEHWTKYVNCSSSEETENVESWQEYGKIYYGIKRDIEKGEELLTWYGDAAYKFALSKAQSESE